MDCVANETKNRECADARPVVRTNQPISSSWETSEAIAKVRSPRGIWGAQLAYPVGSLTIRAEPQDNVGRCALDDTLLEFDAEGRICALTIEHATERTGIPAFTYEQVAA